MGTIRTGTWKRELCLMVLALGCLPAMADPMGTGFGYQGRLTHQGSSVDANVDMTFTLWDSEGGLTGRLGDPCIVMDVPVTNGLFSVVVNANNEFGDEAFTGDSRWLEIAIVAGHTPTTLSPRQALHPSPLSHFAKAAETAFSGGGTSAWEATGGVL